MATMRGMCVAREPKAGASVCISLLVLLAVPGQTALAEDEITDAQLRFANGTLEGWLVEGDGVWSVQPGRPPLTNPGEPERYTANSLTSKGEAAMGVLRSKPFTIRRTVQRFSIAGADGTVAALNDGDLNYLALRSYPGGEILRKQRPPGVMPLQPVRWITADLVGRRVYLELVDRNPRLNPGGYAWIGIADYRQEDWEILRKPVERGDLFGLKIDEKAGRVMCRTLPFLAAAPEQKGTTRRQVGPTEEVIPVEAAAETLYLLGMINDGWENGTAFWPEHPELWDERPDQLHIGSRIGELEIRYAGGESDRVPLVMGATAWFFGWWSHYTEPIKSRPDIAAEFERRMKVREDREQTVARHERYFLAVRPRNKTIQSLVIRDNPKVRGRPLVSAVTLAGTGAAANLVPFGKCVVDESDLRPRVDAAAPGDWSADLAALADQLYTRDGQLPSQVKLLDFPADVKAGRIRFVGDVKADMLSNIWVANMTQMARHKFNAETGFFRESEPGCPSYGGYTGVGTWAPAGQYAQWAFSRCSDHYATLGLRCLHDDRRLTSYVDFVDKHLYFHRANHDPAKGPPNAALDVARYPQDAPPHWSFIVNEPMAAVPSPVNELPGNQEMDGHGATIVARWLAWRHAGRPAGDWMRSPRGSVYGKSRWDASRDAADFICWLMDYTGRDGIWSEGECTGWGSGRIPPGMERETDPARIRQNYANSDMYEPYPTYVCMTALHCSAQMANAAGESKLAERYTQYAQRLHDGMLRLLAVGDAHRRTWRVSPNSVFPSPHDSLVQAWFSIYRDGLDPARLDPAMTPITRNSLQALLKERCGAHPVLGFGYGIGWLTKAALVLDEMDTAGELLANIARYSYDKNMDYADPARGIDWRPWLWLIPEGTNLLPDGRWHRIGDLSNGANQGITLHALEMCAGIDDTHPRELKLLPRVPAPLSGLEVRDFPVLIPGDKPQTLARSFVSYTFQRSGLLHLRAERPLPTLSVRFGPYDEIEARRAVERGKHPAGTTARPELSGRHAGVAAWWVWIEGLNNVAHLDIDLRP